METITAEPVEIESLYQTALVQCAVDAGSDVRVELIARVREQIDMGVYETPEKLDVALDRLLDEI